jgi:glycosyltransferase involved in cell wall biosynthesis
LAEAIRKALALDAAGRERLANEARAHAKANFSKDQMCVSTLALYREILHAAAVPRAGAA